MEELLKVDNVYKSYGKKEIVKGVTLSVRPNEIFGLLGPNGAGKTTTFYMIVGLEKPTKGRIFFEGEDITGMPMYQRALRGINYLPQDRSTFQRLSVEDNLKAIIELQNHPAKEAQEKLEDLLDFLAIKGIRKTYGYALSGGESRRVEIARALATNPKILLLDEPFSGIDPLTILDIQKLIVDLVKSYQVGIVITDHNVRETLKITDHAAILVNGRIFASGSPTELTEDEGVREVYLGSHFRLD